MSILNTRNTYGYIRIWVWHHRFYFVLFVTFFKVTLDFDRSVNWLEMDCVDLSHVSVHRDMSHNRVSKNIEKHNQVDVKLFSNVKSQLTYYCFKKFKKRICLKIGKCVHSMYQALSNSVTSKERYIFFTFLSYLSFIISIHRRRFFFVFSHMYITVSYLYHPIPIINRHK